jgi:hypothetical protein
MFDVNASLQVKTGSMFDLLGHDPDLQGGDQVKQLELQVSFRSIIPGSSTITSNMGPNTSNMNPITSNFARNFPAQT